jgi:phosphoglycolate phosphatase-like HAD superfamily hydrolase
MATRLLTGAVIAFDLDGTLVDTAPDLLAALRKTMDCRRRRPATCAK